MDGEGEGTSLPRLMDKASRVAGGREWDDLSFRPALELLVASCNATASLSPMGRRVLDSIVVRHLVNRLLIEAEVAKRPGVATAAVGPAVVVTGLPRTGTTLLHNLLSLDPGSRVLRFWEALRPVPPDPAHGMSEAELLTRARTWLERLYELVPGFRSIHSSTAEGPEECDALLQNDFASQHFDDMFDAQAYSEWLATAPLKREYRSYARQLNVLRRAEDRSKPWVLKSPSHLGHLDALLEACPDTMIVHCHRDPVEAVTSYASLVLSLRQAYSDHVSAAAIGEQAMLRCGLALSRAMEVRAAAPERFVDLAYGELVGNPLATVSGLYERLRWPMTAEVAASVAAFVRQHPQHQHGRHRYTAEDFGLSATKLTSAFSRYLDDPSVNLG